MGHTDNLLKIMEGRKLKWFGYVNKQTCTFAKDIVKCGGANEAEGNAETYPSVFTTGDLAQRQVVFYEDREHDRLIFKVLQNWLHPCY